MSPYGDVLKDLHEAETVPPKIWEISETAALRPAERWRAGIIENRVEAVRHRLHEAGFPYPLRHDPSEGRPYDNNLLHNLLKGMVESTTLVPPDLDLLESDPD